MGAVLTFSVSALMEEKQIVTTALIINIGADKKNKGNAGCLPSLPSFKCFSSMKSQILSLCSTTTTTTESPTDSAQAPSAAQSLTNHIGKGKCISDENEVDLCELEKHPGEWYICIGTNLPFMNNKYYRYNCLCTSGHHQLEEYGIYGNSPISVDDLHSCARLKFERKDPEGMLSKAKTIMSMKSQKKSAQFVGEEDFSKDATESKKATASVNILRQQGMENTDSQDIDDEELQVGFGCSLDPSFANRSRPVQMKGGLNILQAQQMESLKVKEHKFTPFLPDRRKSRQQVAGNKETHRRPKSKPLKGSKLPRSSLKNLNGGYDSNEVKKLGAQLMEDRDRTVLELEEATKNKPKKSGIKQCDEKQIFLTTMKQRISALKSENAGTYRTGAAEEQ
jgi:hypothetical protein